jgi:hypothetical protein
MSTGLMKDTGQLLGRSQRRLSFPNVCLGAPVVSRCALRDDLVAPESDIL